MGLRLRQGVRLLLGFVPPVCILQGGHDVLDVRPRIICRRSGGALSGFIIAGETSVRPVVALRSAAPCERHCGVLVSPLVVSGDARQNQSAGMLHHHAVGTGVASRRSLPGEPRLRPASEPVDNFVDNLVDCPGVDRLVAVTRPAHFRLLPRPKSQRDHVSFRGGSPGGPPTTPTLPQLFAASLPIVTVGGQNVTTSERLTKGPRRVTGRLEPWRSPLRRRQRAVSPGPATALDATSSPGDCFGGHDRTYDDIAPGRPGSPSTHLRRGPSAIRPEVHG